MLALYLPADDEVLGLPHKRSLDVYARLYQ